MSTGDAHRRCPACARPAAADRPASPPRWGDDAGRSGQLAGAEHPVDHRDGPLRAGGGPLLGSNASAATHRGAWTAHPGVLPIVEGTLIRLAVDHLPGQRAAKPVWLWTSAVDADVAAVTCCWQAYLRRFDLEHTIRFGKQVLGWTRPKLRSAARGRPVDLADHCRAHPVAAGPPARTRSAPALGATATGRSADPGPGSAAGFATCGRGPPVRPVHRNPPIPGRVAHPE